MTGKLNKRLALEELQRRREKQIRKEFKRNFREQQLANNLNQTLIRDSDTPIGNELDCACVIHGHGYDWVYVEKLYNMLVRNSTRKIRFHVYTELERSVPPHMIKHVLTEWNGVTGPRKSWWYKMQLFNSEHHQGPLLYFDLDLVLVRNIDWIANLPTRYFWAIKDFRYLWRNNHAGINSSVMWWDTRKFNHIWQEFSTQNLDYICKKFHGDQDYISMHISNKERRTFEEKYIMSWRWQALDGGYDFKSRIFKQPNTGTKFDNETSILVFHGNPKPHETTDPEIIKYWQ